MKKVIVGVFVLFSLSCFKPPVMAPRYSSELLYWCAQEGEWPVYEKSPQHCASISRGKWDKLPITVNAEDSLIPEVLVAIDSFNSQVGFELFRFRVTDQDPMVAIITAGFTPFIAMEAKRFTLDGDDRGAILVYNKLEEKDRSDILVHELGHLVGLRHDSSDKGSIMYPTIAERTARLTPLDIEVIRSLYGR